MITYRAAKDTDFEKIVKFNEEIYSSRPDIREYLVYRLLENPNSVSLEPLYIGEDEEGKIVAQSITLPEKFASKNEIFTGYWGQDYFVKEEYRKYGAGIGIARLFLKKKFYFGMNASPKALQLQKKLGCKILGQLNYFYKPTSGFHLIKFLFHRALKLKNPSLENYTFPPSFNFKNSKFKHIENVEDFKNPKTQWNENIIETLRDKDFIQWRFLFRKNRYFIYQSEQSEENTNPPYFVVRPIRWKAVNCLMLVDYRFNISDPSGFISIIQAVNSLANKLNLYAVVTSSTLTITHSILSEHKYKTFHSTSLFTTFPFEYIEEEGKTNNNFQSSLADGDAEFYFSNNKFVYGKNH